jgi:hypothetical protein
MWKRELVEMVNNLKNRLANVENKIYDLELEKFIESIDITKDTKWEIPYNFKDDIRKIVNKLEIKYDFKNPIHPFDINNQHHCSYTNYFITYTAPTCENCNIKGESDESKKSKINKK